MSYVVLFGAHAYCVGEGDARRRAVGDDLFAAFGVEHLACNHSDPTISLGTYDVVFGPPDDHAALLDDITISVGASDEPLTGGYHLLRELKIGPYLLFGETEPIADDEWEVLVPAPAPIACNEPESCKAVRDLAAR